MSIALEFFTDAVPYFKGHKLVIFLLCLTIVTEPVCPQKDVELACDKTWDLNTDATMTCTILMASYPSKCSPTPTTDIARFRIQVGAGFSERCNDSLTPCNQPRPSSPGCACYEKTSTHYKLEYKFTVTTDDKGTWDCYIPCFNNFVPALSTASAECGKDYNQICEDETPCRNGGTCINNSSASSNYTCICPPVYKGENCTNGPHPTWILFVSARVYAAIYFTFYARFRNTNLFKIDRRDCRLVKMILWVLAALVFPGSIAACIRDTFNGRRGWWRIIWIVLASAACLEPFVYVIIEIWQNTVFGKFLEWQIALFVFSVTGCLVSCFNLFYPWQIFEDQAARGPGGQQNGARASGTHADNKASAGGESTEMNGRDNRGS